MEWREGSTHKKRMWTPDYEKPVTHLHALHDNCTAGLMVQVPFCQSLWEPLQTSGWRQNCSSHRSLPLSLASFVLFWSSQYFFFLNHACNGLQLLNHSWHFPSYSEQALKINSGNLRNTGICGFPIILSNNTLSIGFTVLEEIEDLGLCVRTYLLRKEKMPNKNEAN